MTPADFGDRRIVTRPIAEVDWLLSRLRYVHLRRGHHALKQLSTLASRRQAAHFQTYEADERPGVVRCHWYTHLAHPSDGIFAHLSEENPPRARPRRAIPSLRWRRRRPESRLWRA